ncbi:hypothetical protein F5Y04DRAFT_91017 [Hypomontagnella monticulosa]|nr:hypothetical protein F5Y04DRAFT_91017 [Hypomontagnella monticulosa]
MEQHSTLEVREVEGNHQLYDYDKVNKEAPFRPDSYPQQTPLEIDSSGVYYPEVAHPATREPANKICGLPKRTFYIVLTIVLLVLIGAFVGGLAGGLTSKKNHSTEQPDELHEDPHEEGPNSTPAGNNSSPARPNVNILSISKLASSNRTDDEGTIYRTVFFQDTNNALIVRQWDSFSKTWATCNITEVLAGSTTPLNPLPGTPLASFSTPFGFGDEVHLWYIAPDNFITGVHVDYSYGNQNRWEYDWLGDITLETRPGSQLATTWQECWAGDCSTYWLLTYQIPSGDLVVFNQSDSSQFAAVEARAIADNSSLSIIPTKTTLGGKPRIISENLNSGTTGDIYETVYGVVDGQPYSTSQSFINNVPLPEPNMQFTYLHVNASIPPMIIALLPNGTVVAKSLDTDYIPNVKFSGGPPINFTAISAGEDYMLYAINNDEILQYAPEETDRYSFVYVERVYP